MSYELASRPLSTTERAALQKRTARAERAIWAFKDMPVQVGSPCLECGALFYWITGSQAIAPSGYCLNCKPGELETRPALRKLVADSVLDELPPEPEAAEESEEDAHINHQLQMF